MVNPLLIFLPFLSVTALPGTADAAGPDPCAGRRIHIRGLPPHFNTDLLRHCDANAFPLADPSAAATSVPPCESLADHGLGPRTHPHNRSWYCNDARLLEAFFHRRILERDCLADDLADVVFLPYYAALNALSYVIDPALLDESTRHGVALAEFLSPDQAHILPRWHGHDHFLVVAGSTWDYAQSPGVDPRLWGSSSLLRLPELANFTSLTLESRTWPWQEHAIPHPTSFHPSSLGHLRSWLAHARRLRCATLMLFAGGASRPCRPLLGQTVLGYRWTV
ncbi:probable xyloglucan galactosyltransferase GT19 [Zea mays]|jgi:hypothetical protein|uniref:Putative xyloglucan galactosyltransferase GT19 n=1 Tax=Zea mays TaxID=4577 RepID=A0A1D6KWJ6_MAIZE|nr:probable xyloglucan galactosyltransferase GT19 [Zea mays]ONM06841.1 putative xyloglucan galactosyltransferase GT19 [Zea mays]|eukprot:XP_008666721.1 probable xyloglucan galactosyltransferase GT19 [Zea mays]